MVIMILDEDGNHILNDKEETVLCPECNATNNAINEVCTNCGCKMVIYPFGEKK
jgi:hypothetical protein